MRKEAGFEVMDRIIIFENGNEKIEDILKTNKAQICKEVLADDIIFGNIEGYEKEWKINSENVVIGVKRV